MSEDISKIFTDEISNPFTTFKCPKCGYRGQIASCWANLSGQKMCGVCSWCDYSSPLISKGKGEEDFLIETWISDITTKEVTSEKT